MVRATDSGVIEVEIDAPNNANLYFGPTQSRVRGRFDVRRIAEPEAAKLINRWPDPIPGQRIALDPATGEGEIVEPLYSPEHAALREKIAARGCKLEAERQVFTADAATWLYWIAGAIEAGLAKLVRGSLPAELPGKPQTRFHSVAHVDPIDRLAAAMEKQNEMLAELIKARK